MDLLIQIVLNLTEISYNLNRIKTALISLQILIWRLHHLPVPQDEPLVRVWIIDWDLLSRLQTTGAAATQTVQVEEEDGQEDTQDKKFQKNCIWIV